MCGEREKKENALFGFYKDDMKSEKEKNTKDTFGRVVIHMPCVCECLSIFLFIVATECGRNKLRLFNRSRKHSAEDFPPRAALNILICQWNFTTQPDQL